MKVNKVKHNDCFFIVHDESFYYEVSDIIKKEGVKESKLMQYKWVIPMYVKSINDNFDGVESFDLCPVDVTTIKDHTRDWKWSRNYEYNEIGKTIFYTEDEAWRFYNKKYSEENKKVYEEIRRLRFIQDQKSNLI